MAKITQYPAKTVPSNNDEFVLHDPSSASTKKMTRGDLIGGAPLPADSVDEQAIANGSVTNDKVGYTINYDGGSLSSGSNSVSFTPTYSGLLKVEARGRRNSESVADTTITISGPTGVSDSVQSHGVGRGNTDGFVSASFLGSVTAGTPVSLNIAMTGITSNATYLFYIIPGNAIKLT